MGRWSFRLTARVAQARQAAREQAERAAALRIAGFTTRRLRPLNGLYRSDASGDEMDGGLPVWVHDSGEHFLLRRADGALVFAGTRDPARQDCLATLEGPVAGPVPLGDQCVKATTVTLAGCGAALKWRFEAAGAFITTVKDDKWSEDLRPGMLLLAIAGEGVASLGSQEIQAAFKRLGGATAALTFAGGAEGAEEHSDRVCVDELDGAALAEVRIPARSTSPGCG